jgi:hypothetical protein
MIRFFCSKLPLLSCLFFLSLNTWAGDRPYLATNTAVAEEDDDGVWSVATGLQHVGVNSIASGSVEYAFNPTTSVQFEFTRTRDSDAAATEHEAEIEFKHLFNHIARDGWGWGVSASLIFSRPQDKVWRHGGVAFSVPYSLSLWDGDGLLHLNAGFNKPMDDDVQWKASAAIERKVAKHTTLFAELALQGKQALLHSGIRYWVKRDKFAIDASLQRVSSNQQSSKGFVIGFNLFDL